MGAVLYSGFQADIRRFVPLRYTEIGMPGAPASRRLLRGRGGRVPKIPLLGNTGGRLDETEASLRTIQELGRWANIRMVQRYLNLSEWSKKEAIDRL